MHTQSYVFAARMPKMASDNPTTSKQQYINDKIQTDSQGLFL